MDEHKKYLADRLLSEEQPVTYRLLSRALNVHVNTAKEMLYDFHSQQNALKPSSIHATYLVYGTRSVADANGNGDVEMSSSFPDNESVSEEAPAATLTLAREENLKDVLAGYHDVTSIHIYSLAPHPLKDLSLLSDVARSVAEYSAKEDRLATAKTYGTIQNPQVRRRDLKGRRSAPPAPTQPLSAIKKEAPPTKPALATKVKQEVKQESPAATSSRESTPASTTAKSTTAPTLKRGNSGGGIMQSFAKSKPPKPKPATTKKEEDTTMALSDDGEADDMDIVPSKAPAADAESVRVARKQREEDLRRMMDDDDEDEDEDVKKEEAADEEMEDAPEPEPEPQPEAKEEKEPAEIISSSSNGRRRGKRRVMKKKRTLDDQGYMVTIQEPGWESFSEDEAPPPAKKVATSASASSSQGTTGKAKKPAGKGGQGSIMSFFAKK
ncbi:DNA polymerase delta subunit 3 [Paramyrothecium foliicola]|nr:DNA polymerase delta subunit 3 [Paramyrothecium foliicola]